MNQGHSLSESLEGRREAELWDKPPAAILAHFDHLLSYRIARTITVLTRFYRPFDPDIDGPRPQKSTQADVSKTQADPASQTLGNPTSLACASVAIDAIASPAEASALTNFAEGSPQPGADCDPLTRLTGAALPFFQSAGFRKLGWDEIHASSDIATPQGINLLVNSEHYDASMVLVLPTVSGKRKHRPWWALFFKREYQVDLYPRVILLLKPNPARFKDPDLDTDHVFLRLFRNVPVHDLEMVFPGGKVKLTWLDRLMIYYPIIAGIGLLLYQIIPELMKNPIPSLLTQAVLAVGFYALFKWTVAMALGGWSWRTYSAYRGKMERYGLKLTRNLYLQTMDSNLGVFTRLGADIAQREREFVARVVLQVESGDSTDAQTMFAVNPPRIQSTRGKPSEHFATGAPSKKEYLPFAQAPSAAIREAGRVVLSRHYAGGDPFLERLLDDLIAEKEKFDKRVT